MRLALCCVVCATVAAAVAGDASAAGLEYTTVEQDGVGPVLTRAFGGEFCVTASVEKPAAGSAIIARRSWAVHVVKLSRGRRDVRLPGSHLPR